MERIRYLQRKDRNQRLICKTLHEHDIKVIWKLNKKLNKDGSKKRIFNHIKRLMRRQVRKEESIN